MIAALGLVGAALGIAVVYAGVEDVHLKDLLTAIVTGQPLPHPGSASPDKVLNSPGSPGDPSRGGGIFNQDPTQIAPGPGINPGGGGITGGTPPGAIGASTGSQSGTYA